MRSNDIRIKGYRNTVNRCMAAMIALIAFMTVFSLITELIGMVLVGRLDAVTYEVVTSLLDSAAYMAMFMLPILVFKLFSKNAVYYPLPARAVLPKRAIRISLAAVGVVLPTTVINSLIVNYLVQMAGMQPDFSALETEINGIHSIVLLFISLAIVPALCEEFLFRGVMLKNLMPYGKTTAVFVSALLFALMHQNFYQFFYTFIAGLVLGYVFLLTGSIWCGVLIHFINNFVSVLTDAVSYFLNEDAAAIAQYLIMSVFLFLGVLSFISLVKQSKKEKALREGSVYGVTEELPVFDSDLKLTEKEAVKNFFTPLAIVVIVAIVIMALLTMSLLVIPMPDAAV